MNDMEIIKALWLSPSYDRDADHLGLRDKFQTWCHEVTESDLEPEPDSFELTDYSDELDLVLLYRRKGFGSETFEETGRYIAEDGSEWGFYRSMKDRETFRYKCEWMEDA